MAVITLSRQVGSGGDDIAKAVAERLNLRLIGQEIINEAARRAGVPEVALAELDELGLLGLKPRKADLELYCETACRLMREWAAGDNVLFLGRGSHMVLAGQPGVLRVRVIAPLAQRIAWAQANWAVPADIAAALIEARDRARANYVRRYYGAQASAPEAFDLILNMAHLPLPAAIELICAAVQALYIPVLEVSS